MESATPSPTPGLQAEVVKLGHGKVRALTRFYDSLKDINNNPMGEAHRKDPPKRDNQNTPTPTRSEVANQSPNGLSNEEELRIMNQLQRWSEFGSVGDELNEISLEPETATLQRSQSYDGSIDSSMSAYDDGTRAEDTSIGNPPPERSRLHAHLGVLKSPTIERKPENHRRPPSSSMANNFHAALHELNPHVLPDAFMLRKVQRCRPDCSNIENQPVALSFLYGARLSSPSSSSASCPDLGTSPGVRQTTPRQLKKQHNILRLLRQINGKLDGNVDTTAPTAAVVDDDES